jgi:hypothetical protein
MESVILVAVLILGFIAVFNKKHAERELISSATDLHRGNHSEQRLVLALRKKGVHPEAIFHDLYLKKRNGSYSQIDLVMATSVGLIVFEVKDYVGWIFGSGNSTYWTQVLAYGKEKYRLYNPIIQNRRHIEELRKVSPQFEQTPMFSVILFYGDCEFKKLNSIPENVYIIRPNELNRTIDLITSQNPPANYSNKREIATVLREAATNGGSEEVQQGHVNYVKAIKDQSGARDGRISGGFNFNPIPRSVRKTLRWLRNLR